MENLFYPGGDAMERPFSREENELLDFINRKIASGITLKEVVRFLFDSVQSVIPCDRIGIAFMEENDQRMTLHIVVSRYDDLFLAEGYGADIDGSSLKTVFFSDKPRVINDLALYGKSHPGSESTMLLVQEGIRSSMTCPLKVEGRPVGLLFFSSKNANAYNEKQVAFHLAIAERLSQAVEKTYMIERLTDSINSYLEMLGFVTHELRSPLHSIITVAETILAGYFGTMEEKQRVMIGRILERAEQLNRTVDDYLNLSRFENNTMAMSIKKSDVIADIITPSLETVEPLIAANGMSLHKNMNDDLPSVNCDPELLKIVLGNLLSNAVKYGKEGGAIDITAAITGEDLQISVKNEGPGFPAKEKKRLFRKFSRIPTPELSRKIGSGIGLYTCWKIVKLHGGSIRAESKEGEWAEFSFRIPMA